MFAIEELANLNEFLQVFDYEQVNGIHVPIHPPFLRWI